MLKRMFMNFYCVKSFKMKKSRKPNDKYKLENQGNLTININWKMKIICLHPVSVFPSKLFPTVWIS